MVPFCKFAPFWEQQMTSVHTYICTYIYNLMQVAKTIYIHIFTSIFQFILICREIERQRERQRETEREREREGREGRAEDPVPNCWWASTIGGRVRRPCLAHSADMILKGGHIIASSNDVTLTLSSNWEYTKISLKSGYGADTLCPVRCSG